MDFDTAQIQSAYTFANSNSRGRAPRPVLQAALSLSLGQVPAEGYAEAVVDDALPRTTWRLLWLLDNRLIYVEGHRNVGNWLSHGGGKADGLVAWTRPVTSVVSINVVETSLPDKHFGAGWAFSSRYSVSLDDGSRIELPLFGAASGHQDADQAEALAVALLTRVHEA